MSEYQYYEFRAIDRPLTRKGVTYQLRSLSTAGGDHADELHQHVPLGRLQGQPCRPDGFLLRRLRLRRQLGHAPADVSHPPASSTEAASAYCDGEILSLKAKKEHVLSNSRPRTSRVTSGPKASTGCPR